MQLNSASMNRALLTLCGLLLAVAATQPATAGETVSVGLTTQGAGSNDIPIALPLPKGDGSGADEYYATLKRDLEISGYFKIIDPKAYVEPASAGIHLGEFDFASWRTPGAAALAKTSLGASGEGLRAEVWVYDVAGGTKLGAKAFSGPKTAGRTLAHRTADAIISLVTGNRSFFDTRVAFVANGSGNKEVYVMDVDGGGKRQITKNKSINLAPRWNHSGTALCFTSYFNGNPDLYVADLLKSAIRRVSARTGINTGCSWSPSGESIALTLSPGSDSDIFTIDPLAGTQIARLTSSPGIDVSPSWSPDGSKLAFVSERGGGAQIYVMNADGSNVHRVSFQGAQNTSPSWSPKGDKIAFVGRDGGFDVFTVNLDGSGMTRVTQGAGDNEDPSWSPDGDYLVFSSTRTGSAHIWLSSADGRHQVQLSQGAGGYTNPHWSNHLSW
ncbi:protein TolB [Deltaproteobacteria bacterium]|nr:protein TolB [Deltaproteobacteria bacterium]